MGKYKIGIFVLILFALGLFGYVAYTGLASKDDAKTYKAAQKIAEKLNNYTLNKEPPNSLSELGVKDVPSTITYTKKSSSSYEFCATYKYAASSSVDIGDIFTGATITGTGSGAYPDPGSGDTNYGYLYISPNYKKGKNCQTITGVYGGGYYNYNLNDQLNNSSSSSSQPSASNNYSSSACSSAYDSYYGLKGEGTVSGVNTSAKTISFNVSGQTVTDANGKPAPAVSSMKYDSITLFCSASGQETTVSDVNSGDKVKFYASSSTSTILDKVQL